MPCPNEFAGIFTLISYYKLTKVFIDLKGVKNLWKTPFLIPYFLSFKLTENKVSKNYCFLTLAFLLFRSKEKGRFWEDEIRQFKWIVQQQKTVVWLILSNLLMWNFDTKISLFNKIKGS